MIIKNLTLKNYRKFNNSTIEFPDGVTGVVGLNGVGKSTIFEAIAWVLYGSVAARTAADQIKRQGTNNFDHCRVELDFTFENENYRIFREMTGKNHTLSATAALNSKIAATGAETVNKYVQQKLGMDFKSFFTSIFAKQKELNVLSALNASERRPLILRMLGINALDEIIKEIRRDKKNKEEIVTQLGLDLVDENGGLVPEGDKNVDKNTYLINRADGVMMFPGLQPFDPLEGSRFNQLADTGAVQLPHVDQNKGVLWILKEQSLELGHEVVTLIPGSHELDMGYKRPLLFYSAVECSQHPFVVWLDYYQRSPLALLCVVHQDLSHATKMVHIYLLLETLLILNVCLLHKAFSPERRDDSGRMVLGKGDQFFQR